MNDPLDRLRRSLDALQSSWARTPGDAFADIDEMNDAELMTAHVALVALRRQVESAQIALAARMARASRPELGPEGLAKKQGYRNPVALIAATAGTSAGDAARLVALGEATAPRMTFSGEAAPPRHPHVARAVESGRISPLAAHAIVTMLDRVALRCSVDGLNAAEATLCEQADGLTADQLAKVIARAEAHLDPDGIEPREDDLRAARSLHMFERGGMLHITAKLDPEKGAPVKLAIESFVSAEFRAMRDESAAVTHVDDPDRPRPSVPQLQADALSLLATHALGCAHADDVPLEGATVVVRVSLEDLEAGAGVATIDGVSQPVSIATARRMAAGGAIIPCVLDSTGEILDWGRRRRLFTKAQKLALAERDGGCAMCGLPPGMTKVHHLRWWSRDAGPTDLANGVLLCESCHHRIHDNGWDVRIDGTGVHARVWFVPPRHVDPMRVPRLGGRARFDYVA